MALKLRESVNNKFKFATIFVAVLALAVQPMYGFVSERVANASSGSGVWSVSPTGDDQGPCTESNPCKTISHAIAEAVSGGTVEVASGIYSENIVINKDINLVGSSAKLQPLVSDYTLKIVDGASDVSIEGLTLESTFNKSAVKVASDVSLNSLSLRNVNIDSYKAVYIGDGAGTLGTFTLENSTVSSNYPVYIDHPTDKVSITGNTFNIRELNRGVVFANQNLTSVVDISDNTFNMSTGSDRAYMNFIKYTPAIASLLGTAITDNRFVQNGTDVRTMISSDNKAVTVDDRPDTTRPEISVHSSSPKNNDYLSGVRYTREGQSDKQRNRIILKVTDDSGIKKVALYVTNHATGVKVKEYAMIQHNTNTEQWYADVDTTKFDNGVYDIAARAVDNENNASYFNNRRTDYRVTIDNTAPKISVKKGPQFTVGKTSAKTFSKVSFKLSDNTKFEGKYSINGVDSTVGSSNWGDANYIKVGQRGAVYGENTITLRDLAGNSTSYTFTLDNKAPTISVKDGYVGNESDKVFSNVSFKLYDKNSVDYAVVNGWTLPLTDNDWSDADFGAIKNHLNLGNNTITVFDIAGNSATYEFAYDNVKPTITGFDLQNLVNGQFNPSKVVAHASEDDTFVTSVSIDTYKKQADGTWKYTYSPFVQGTPMGNERNYAEFKSSDARINTDGTYKLVAWAVDKAGNVSEKTESSEFTVDATLPIAEITFPSDGDILSCANTDNCKIMVKATANDANLDHYYYKIYNYDTNELVYKNTVYPNGVFIDDDLYPWDLKDLASGEYVIYIKVADSAGNTATSKKVHVMVDNTAPSVSITSSTLNDDNKTYTITGTTEDELVPVVTLDGEELDGVVVDGDTWTVVTPELTDKQTYTVVATTTDDAANVGSSVTTANPDDYTFTAEFVEANTDNNKENGGDSSSSDSTTTTRRSAPRSVAAATVLAGVATPVVAAQTQTDTDDTDEDVAGASTQAGSGEDVKGVATSNSDKAGWNMLGFAWYWWLVLVAAIAAFWWFLAAKKRRAEEQA